MRQERVSVGPPFRVIHTVQDSDDRISPPSQDPIETAAKGLEAAGGAATLALGAASDGIDRISGFFGRAKDKSKVLRQNKASNTE